MTVTPSSFRVTIERPPVSQPLLGQPPRGVQTVATAEIRDEAVVAAVHHLDAAVSELTSDHPGDSPSSSMSVANV